MTRKDYILIAAALRVARPAVIPGSNVIMNGTARSVWYACVTAVANALKADNARFEASRFFDACGVPD